MKYNLVQNEYNANVTVLIDGELYGADSEHQNWDQILAKILANDETGLVGLFDAAVVASQKFEHLSERVTVKNGQIYFDGELVDNALTQQVVRFINEGVEDFKPLVNFFEKVMQNPNNHSRQQLYGWLSKYQFAIADDGDFLAYKSVNRENEDDDYQFRSTMQGYAIVDGVEQNGFTKYNIGSVVEMPRGSVEWNPSVGCSTGLHAGTYEYARNYSGNEKLLVKINPRDVVSVPTDSSEQKLRVCRLVVQDYATERIDTPIWSTNVDWNGIPVEEVIDEEVETCKYCGEEECDEECQDCPDCGNRECTCNKSIPSQDLDDHNDHVHIDYATGGWISPVPKRWWER